MDFDADEGDRIDGIGLSIKLFQAAATQLGPHLHVEFECRDLYLAWTELLDVEADNLYRVARWGQGR